MDELNIEMNKLYKIIENQKLNIYQINNITLLITDIEILKNKVIIIQNNLQNKKQHKPPTNVNIQINNSNK